MTCPNIWKKHVPKNQPDFYGKPRYFHGHFQEQTVSHCRRVPANLPIGRQIQIWYMYDILTHISNITNGKSPDWLIDIVLYAVDVVHNPIDNPKTYGFYVQ